MMTSIGMACLGFAIGAATLRTAAQGPPSGRPVASGGVQHLAPGATAPAQQPAVPVRPLGKIVAQAADTLRSVTSVRQLSDGRLFVEDGTAHRVLLFDSTLTRATVVIGAAGSTVRDFGSTSVGLA